ncbi:MAG: ParB N-terminal domain-containing protein [Nostoc desertorum CM1-VF14]|jgi:hypothetical protein|nr:ParB N-terminal domain-containing protein [Nostoc desertorum CM1-VF14]
MLRDLTPYRNQEYVDLFYEFFPNNHDPSDLNIRGLGVYRIRVYERKVVIISDIGIGCSLINCVSSVIEKIRNELELPLGCKYIQHEIPALYLQWGYEYFIQEIEINQSYQNIQSKIEENFELIRGREDNDNTEWHRLSKEEIEEWIKLSLNWGIFVQSEAQGITKISHRSIKKLNDNILKNNKVLDKSFYQSSLDFVRQNFSDIQDKYGNKLYSLNIDKQKMEEFLRCFYYIDNYNELTSLVCTPTEWISTERVLSCPWNEERLAESLAYLKLGHQTPPPIQVDVYILGRNNYWYTVIDGMHRTTAAKMNGIQEIPARVFSESLMPLNYFVLFDGHLFYVGGKTPICLSRGKPEKYFYDLEKIGIKRFVDNILGTVLFFGYFFWLKLQQRIRPYKIWL